MMSGWYVLVAAFWFYGFFCWDQVLDPFFFGWEGGGEDLKLFCSKSAETMIIDESNRWFFNYIVCQDLF